jgi:formate-dependent nitrite reductase membrane component NrfD
MKLQGTSYFHRFGTKLISLRLMAFGLFRSTLMGLLILLSDLINPNFLFLLFLKMQRNSCSRIQNQLIQSKIKSSDFLKRSTSQLPKAI